MMVMVMVKVTVMVDGDGEMEEDLVDDDHDVYQICPGTKFEITDLFIEGEILDVYTTGAFIDGRWNPVNVAATVHEGVGHKRYFVVTIGTANKHSALSRQLETI